MASDKFKCGDVVRLKSGGLDMTVADMRHPDPGLVHLIWMDVNGCMRGDVLHEDLLVGKSEIVPGFYGAGSLQPDANSTSGFRLSVNSAVWP